MSDYVACPGCGSSDVKKVRYVPQGGLLWSPFLNFAKCRSCGARFHGKTGERDPQVPKVFRVISVLIIMAFLGALFGFVLGLQGGSFDEVIKGLAK